MRSSRLILYAVKLDENYVTIPRYYESLKYHLHINGILNFSIEKYIDYFYIHIGGDCYKEWKFNLIYSNAKSTCISLKISKGVIQDYLL
jgi:hypothetical protein